MACLIVTGMHRSGTSLITGLLQKAGVDIGDRLLRPDRANPRGFFEDTDFLLFHERALHARGRTFMVGSPFVFEPTDEERAAAALLVAERAGKSMWGWKDPRTSLFLDFWDSLVPDARYLFLYRHPFDALMSMVLRRDFHNLGLLEGVETWCVYNQALLEFTRKHRERVVLCEAYTAIDRIGELARILAERLGERLELTPAARDALYHPDELHRVTRPPDFDRVFGRFCSEAVRRYRELQDVADLPEIGTANGGGELAGLSAVERLLDTVGAPPARAIVRGLLLLLAALVDSRKTENLFVGHAQELVELELARNVLEKRWKEAVESGKSWEAKFEDARHQIAAVEAYLRDLHTRLLFRLGASAGLLPRFSRSVLPDMGRGDGKDSRSPEPD